MADINQNSQELNEILARISDDMRLFSQTTEDAAASMKRASQLRERELKTAGKSTADALGHVGAAAASAGKAMLNGEKGAAAFNSSLDDMAMAAKAAGVALSFLIPGGFVVKALVAGATALTSAVTSYAKAANEMSDKLYKGFSGMAVSGAAASDGMTGLFKDAKKLGLSMNELDGFVQLVGENSKDLALFGGTVFEGRKKFAEVGEAMEPYRESLFKAGFTQEQINKATMGYIRLQSQIGLSQDKTTDQLAEGARKYLLEQDALAKLTGMTREDAEKARERVRGQEQFAAKSLELRMKGNEEGAKRLEDFYLLIAGQDEATAKGMADIAAGNLLTEEAQQVFRATNGKILDYNEKLISGEMTSVQAMQALGDTIGKTVKESGAALGKVGNYSKYIGNLAGHVKISTLAAGDLEKNYQKILEDREKGGVEGGKAADELMEDRARLIKAQQEANKATESFIASGMVPAQKAMIKLAEVTGASVDAVNNMFNSEQTAGEAATAFTAEEAEAAKPMLAKAQQERDIYSSEEFKNWQKEQGANFMQKGMYHEKYGVAAYMKEKGIEESKPVERATGSLGSVGKLIEDFGPGTPAILHGKEGVVTEMQLRSIIEQAQALGAGKTTGSSIDSTDAKEYASKIQESTKLIDEQNEIDADIVGLKKQNYAAEKKQSQIRIDLGKKEKFLADEDVRKYRSFVDEKNLYYEDLLDFIDEQFGILEETSGAAPGSLGSGRSSGSSAAVGGGSFAAPTAAVPGSTEHALSTIRTKESGGNYAAESKSSSASGAYQFTDSTWQALAKKHGIGMEFARAKDAPKEIQDALASKHVEGILEKAGGDITKVPLAWYTGNIEGKMSRRALAANSGLTPQEYQSKWLAEYNKQGGTSAAPTAPAEPPAKYTTSNPAYDQEMARLDAQDADAKKKLADRRAQVTEARQKAQLLQPGKEITAADGGMFSGPISGYPATLHGTEAVIPLKDGAIPVQMPGMDVMATQNEELKNELAEMRKEMKDLLAQLTEAVNTAKNSGTRERMVSVLENIARSQSTNADLSRKLVQQGAS